jgi:ADP-ribose pyrophosphatase
MAKRPVNTKPKSILTPEMSKSRAKPKARISVDARNRVFDGFLKIDEVIVSFDRLAGKGRMEGVKRLIMERGDSAAVLIYETDTDKVLLTRQVRPATIAKGPGVIDEIVAGAIEKDEAPRDCIRREIEEEIGYRVPARSIKHIGMFYVSPGGTSERIVLFYAQVQETQRVNAGASGVASEHEDIALVKVDRKSFIRQALSGKLDDAKTLIAGLWLAQLYGDSV